MIDVPIDKWEDLTHCLEKEGKVVYEDKTNELGSKRMEDAKIKRKIEKK